MPRHVVLLRGINLVKRNRIAMPQLRAVLESAGYSDVVSYVQSGNVVLSSRASQQRVVMDVKALIQTHFGLDIAILVRSREEVAAVVQRNPLAAIATNTWPASGPRSLTSPPPSCWRIHSPSHGRSRPPWGV